jgi:DNA repair exonuclease SbcCD nuclease subunit
MENDMNNLTTIAVISDIHWGANFTQTIALSDALKKYFIEKLKQSPPDIIVIGGDLYDKKISVNSTEAALCNDFIINLVKSFPKTYILIIKGTRSHDLNQLDLFKPLVNNYFRIYEKAGIEYILDMKLLIIPEEYYPDKKVYEPFLNVKEPYDWVFFHGMFSHAGGYARQGNPNKICFSWDDFKDNVYGRVSGGHIHKMISYKNIDYTGSFDRDCHGEEDDKGYYLYTYDKKKKKTISSEFIVNEDAHKYITILYKDIAELSTDDAVKLLSKKSTGVKSLRIKIEKGDLITNDKLHFLLTISFNIPNIIIDKKDQASEVICQEMSLEKQKELEERKKEIENYKNMSFEEITIKFAKDKLNAVITEDDIKKSLESAQ